MCPSVNQFLGSSFSVIRVTVRDIVRMIERGRVRLTMKRIESWGRK
jgi:hypothetical protein